LWNAWRKAEHFRPSFEGVDFRSAEVDFSLFDLRSVSFAGAKFGTAHFDGVKMFGPNFSGAVLDGPVSFNFAVISEGDFRGAVFNGPASFDSAVLTQTSFEGASFGFRAGAGARLSGFRRTVSFKAALLLQDWEGSTQGDETSFRGVQFGTAMRDSYGFSPLDVSFDGALFADGLRFDGAQFWGDVTFKAWSAARVEEHWRRLAGGIFKPGEGRPTLIPALKVKGTTASGFKGR
jgi:hypothetical protein